MNKKCGFIITVLLLIILAGAYKFMIQGSTTVSTDNRTIIHLTAGERDLVLAEMRGFLESVQAITQGIVKKDMGAVAAAAKKSGKASQGEVPGSLVGKLPITFKKLGFDTHSKFDQLALDAESLADSDHALEQLATLMQNCLGCHAAYQLKASDK